MQVYDDWFVAAAADLAWAQVRAVGVAVNFEPFGATVGAVGLMPATLSVDLAEALPTNPG